MTTPTFNVHTRVDKKSKTQVLLLEGEFGLKYIDRIKSRIDSINFDSSNIVIELKNINSIDLSTVQLVYSLKKTLCDKGKTVNIVSEIPEDIVPIIRNAGFYDFLKS
jgi:MFS superfamily sulfate permease-like transporter